MHRRPLVPLLTLLLISTLAPASARHEDPGTQATGGQQAWAEWIVRDGRQMRWYVVHAVRGAGTERELGTSAMVARGTCRQLGRSGSLVCEARGRYREVPEEDLSIEPDLSEARLVHRAGSRTDRVTWSARGSSMVFGGLRGWVDADRYARSGNVAGQARWARADAEVFGRRLVTRAGYSGAYSHAALFQGAEGSGSHSFAPDAGVHRSTAADGTVTWHRTVLPRSVRRPASSAVGAHADAFVVQAAWASWRVPTRRAIVTYLVEAYRFSDPTEVRGGGEAVLIRIRCPRGRSEAGAVFLHSSVSRCSAIVRFFSLGATAFLFDPAMHSGTLELRDGRQTHTIRWEGTGTGPSAGWWTGAVVAPNGWMEAYGGPGALREARASGTVMGASVTEGHLLRAGMIQFTDGWASVWDLPRPGDVPPPRR
jgi:hypothetical protein